MEFLDRRDELRRLDHAMRSSGAFAAIWGRRRVGKSRLLIEWSRRRDGLYTDTPLARLGPWEPARRYWRGNAPEFDIVARSVDGRRLLVGEAKWSARSGAVSRAGPRPGAEALPGAAGLELVSALFVPEAAVKIDASTGVHLVDAGDVIAVLR